MKEFKGTTGPWLVEDNGHFYDINAVRGTVGNVCSSKSWFDDDEHRGPVAMANAKLIAASPDLLSAIQNLVEVYDSDDGKQWTTASKKAVIAEARAAIDKALGE